MIKYTLNRDLFDNLWTIIVLMCLKDNVFFPVVKCWGKMPTFRFIKMQTSYLVSKPLRCFLSNDQQ